MQPQLRRLSQRYILDCSQPGTSGTGYVPFEDVRRPGPGAQRSFNGGGGEVECKRVRCGGAHGITPGHDYIERGIRDSHLPFP
jgi:hypothetical protein